MRRGAALAAAALASGGMGGPAGAAAQETPADTAVYRLGTLEATVARTGLPLSLTPLSISTVDARTAAEGGRQLDLHEALRRVPGVAVDNRHNASLGSRISIRGIGARSAFGVRGIRILLDGIPLTLPDGQSTLANVDLGTIERVEVIRGPAGMLYGNAAGGVVALHSTQPPTEGLLETRVAVGSYGTDDLANLRQVRVEGGGGTDRARWFGGASHNRLAGYREHSAMERTMATGQLRYAPDAVSLLTVTVHAAALPRAENPGALPRDSVVERPRMAWPSNVDMAAGEQSGQAQAGVSYARLLGPVRLETAAHGQARRLDNPLAFGRFIRLRRGAGGLRTQLTGAAGRVAWTAGLEVEAQRDDRVERENLQGEIGGDTFQDRIDRVMGLAPFALIQGSVGSALELRAGGRYDRVSFASEDRGGVIGEDRSGRRVMDAWSGSLGGLLRMGGGLSLWSALSTWFQTPTTTELINAPPPPAEPCCRSGFNPELDPTRGRGLEIGLRGDHGPAGFELVAFTMSSSDEILPLQVEGGEGREFYQNAGRSLHRGVEAAAAVQLPGGLSGDLAYTFGDYRFHPSDERPEAGNRIPGVAPHRLHAGVGWRGRSSRVRWQIEWVARYPVDDANLSHNDAYAVLDLQAGHRFRAGTLRLEPFLQVSNLLDTRYNSSVTVNARFDRYYEPAPGRALLLGLAAAFR